MSTNLKDALSSIPKRYSDLTIACGNREFKVHKIIVCTQCKALAAMIDKCWTKAIPQTITIEDEDVDVVDKAITYLYNNFDRVNLRWFFIDDSIHFHASNGSSVHILLAKLYVLGVKWGLHGLQVKSYQQMSYSSDNKTVTDEDLLSIIHIIWSSILGDNDMFKDTIVTMILRYMQHAADGSPLYETLDAVPGVSLALIRKVGSMVREQALRLEELDACKCGSNSFEERILDQCTVCKTVQEGQLLVGVSL